MMIITEDSTAMENEKALGEMERCDGYRFGTFKGELGLKSAEDVFKMSGSCSLLKFIVVGAGCT